MIVTQVAVGCFQIGIQSYPRQLAILTEYFPEQVNIIQVYRGKWNKGLLLDRDQMTGSLILGE